MLGTDTPSFFNNFFKHLLVWNLQFFPLSRANVNMDVSISNMTVPDD